jgi:hypothetical protein
MDNFPFNTNFLTEDSTSNDESFENPNASLSNLRRWSLEGNPNTNFNEQRNSWSPLQPSPPSSFLMTSSPTASSSSSSLNNLANKFNEHNQQLLIQRQSQQVLISQQLQKQKQAQKQQSEENLYNFIKYYGQDHHCQQQSDLTPGSLPSQACSFLSSPHHRKPSLNQAAAPPSALRRKSYGAQSLKPVFEDASQSFANTKPNTQQFLIYQQLQKQKMEKSLQKSLSLQSKEFKSSPVSVRPRMRAASVGNASLFDSGLSDISSHSPSKSASLSNSSMSNLYDSFEEKLSITGNIFQKREDWSIIGKLPVTKQNSIHIRVSDEGPYGNDEIRCFVLSHLSSLKITDITCILCTCNLVVYDRFPLIDGILFISPYNYSPTKSIPTPLSHKSQFMYGLCLQCLNSNREEHEIKCVDCGKVWQTMGCSSLQIGTLYKFDVLAAFSCCESRLSCTSCQKPIVDLEASKSKCFSSFSQEIECPHCHVVATHFTKPLQKMFTKSKCEASLDKTAASSISEE